MFNKIYQSSKRYSVRFLCMHSKGSNFCLKRGKGCANVRIFDVRMMENFEP